MCKKLCARYGDPVITFEVQESKKVTSLPSTGQLQKHQLKPINPDFTVADDGTKCSWRTLQQSPFSASFAYFVFHVVEEKTAHDKTWPLFPSVSHSSLKMVKLFASKLLTFCLYLLYSEGPTRREYWVVDLLLLLLWLVAAHDRVFKWLIMSGFGFAITDS